MWGIAIEFQSRNVDKPMKKLATDSEPINMYRKCVLQQADITSLPLDTKFAKLEQKLAEVKELYRLKYGEEADEEEADVHYDADGTPWIQTVGTGIAKDQRVEKLEQMLSLVKDMYSHKYCRDVDMEYDEDGTAWNVTEGTGVPRDLRVERLEQKLAEVKELYRLKYGEEADEEEADVHYDADGTPWIQTVGTGIAKDQRVEKLEQMLSFVKDMYSQKYGRDVDKEYDEDGTAWNVTEGTGVPRDLRVERLEQKLAEVKELYRLKYGDEADEEEADVHYDADGTPWIQTVGTGVAKDQRLEKLEQTLSFVKDMYSQKYGRDVDKEYDEDGTAWNVTEGTGVPRDLRVERLEQKLAEVKELYRLKYGDEADEEEADVHYDADGTPWIQTVGTGIAKDQRVEKLEQMLSLVKDMYSHKYCRDVDMEYDEDGTAWNVTEGTGVPRDLRVERLEQKLAEVKELYRLKYGEEADEEEADVHYDADGTPWIQTVGTGVAKDQRLEKLEQTLSFVKDMYSQKYGRDVDKEYDEDGTAWNVTEGTGVPRDLRVERLEQKLAEVKELYRLKYGDEADEEEADVHYDADGTPWIQTVGTGIAKDQRVEKLEQMLSLVKDMYSHKYCRDVDMEYDEDGTAWNVTEGTGVPRDLRVERLEQKLAEVKELYRLKYGEEADEEEADVHYDADGTPWIQTVGTGIAKDQRVEKLEQMLSLVKDMYSQKYCRDVDMEYDEDGTAWNVTEGTGVPRDLRVERLEQKLAEVKELYRLKYGEEADEEEADVHYDADGTPWIQTVGTGVAKDQRLEKLEQTLSFVKDMYSQKYGRDVDKEYDEDGTAWNVTEGTGVPRDLRVERLEQKLAEVKELYRQKYGDAIYEEEADVHYDADGTPWIQTVGTGVAKDQRLEKLEQTLFLVKDMYSQKYGRDADKEYDEDGTAWNVTEGTGVPRDLRVERLEQKLAEVKELYRLKYGDEADEEEADAHYDADGTPWIQTVGTGVAKDQRLEKLEQTLSFVKDMYSQKYGRDVDKEYDEDGTAWNVTEGTGVPRDLRVERLEQKLAEVKELYRLKYGEEADEEEADVHYDADGTPWIQTVGTGIAKDQRVEKLEQMLSLVKDMYSQKYGRDVDKEYDEDGTAWNVTEGTGVPRDLRVERLEQKLAEVKELYRLKYGEEADEEEADVHYDADGTPWIQTVGTGVAKDQRLEKLEQTLFLVKDMYSQKYGRDVDKEYDEDGPAWNVTEGTGVPRDLRVERLEQKLAEVKALYRLKYGEEADEEEADVHYDADGTPWIQTVGTGIAKDQRLEKLEQTLSLVKDMYSQKYSRDVDKEYDEDGTAWNVTEGTGVPRDLRVERLEQKLAEVKELYRLKYGEEADEEEADVHYDADGTPWIQTVGTGVAKDQRLEKLEQTLSLVKDMYSQKYGRDVDKEYDEDGTAWNVTEGTGVPRDLRVERLEQKLAEVKELYRQKYGDLIQDSSDLQEDSFVGDFTYDVEGTLWIKSITTGSGISVCEFQGLDRLSDRLVLAFFLFVYKAPALYCRLPALACFWWDGWRHAPGGSATFVTMSKLIKNGTVVIQCRWKISTRHVWTLAVCLYASS